VRLCLFCVGLGLAAAQQGECRPCDFGAAEGVTAAVRNRRIRAGTVKSFTPGKEITIDLPMAFDKSYDLAHPNRDNTRVRIAGHIAAGEPVVIIEYEEDGVHCVDIVPEAGLSDGFTPRTAAAGRVAEYVAGERIVLILNGGGSRKFDLRTRGGPHVVVARGISTGDAVCVFEGERNKRRVIRIERVPPRPDSSLPAPAGRPR